MKFVSFHTHTTYSYGDGIGTVKQHVERVKDLGMSALAVSEHGNVNSHAALEREALSAGIKPIFGVEAYFGPVGDKRTQRKYHITLFAQNEKGYRNLNALVTQSYIDSHYWPTVSPANLRKYNEGLVAFSGCSDSFISCSLLGGKLLGDKRETYTDADWQRTRRRIEWFTEIFGTDRFFLEVQRFPQLGRTCILNPAFAELSEATGVSLIATADVHYPFAHQNELQKVLHAGRRSGSVALNEQAWEYDIPLTYPESDEEIVLDLVNTGLSESAAMSAVERTSDLAALCTVELPKARALRFPLPGGTAITCSAKGKQPTEGDLEEVHKFGAALYLKKQIKDGFRQRVSQRPDLKERVAEYSQRVSHELQVIIDKDFSDYFLATADLVNFAKSDDITVGPGRGSAAGSLVCYLLGITEIDPLHPTFSRMIFERFIDKNRADMPDIDLDFDDDLRYRVPERAREIYGNENVCSVANHTGYRSKNSLQDVARAYALPKNTFDAIAKRCPDRNETDESRDDAILYTIESYKDDPSVAALLDRHGNKIRQACELQGGEHSMGIHAGGFIVASEPIPTVCPIYTKEKGTGRKREFAQVIPYEKRDAEHLGLLKMDFLGLKTMGVVGKIRAWTHMPLSKLYNLYYEDYQAGGGLHEEIMEKFREDDLVGIFQYEGPTTRQVVREVSPRTFDELAACVALSRPGPMYGKDSDGYSQTQNYIAIKNGERDWRRIHDTGFDQHVEWTYGQIVYQEQIMWILRDLAGFPTDRVLRVRKIIGKKLGEHQFAELWEEFKVGCGRNGVSEEDAASVWGGITTAAGYAFNTAHSYSYALIAWWTMFFKNRATKEFFAGSLAKNGDGKKQIPRRTALLQDCSVHGIHIEQLTLKESEQNWQPHRIRNAIIPGFAQIPGIAEATADDIYSHIYRMGKLDPDWKDLLAISGIGEDTIVKMYTWTLKADPLGIFKTGDELDAFRKQCENGEFDQYGLPSAEEFVLSTDLPEEFAYVAFVGLVSDIMERDEVESTRQRTGKPVDEIKAKLDAQGAPGEYKKATIFGYDEYGELALRVSRWKYGALSDRIAAIQSDKSILVVYGKTYGDKSNAIQVTNLWVLSPEEQ